MHPEVEKNWVIHLSKMCLAIHHDIVKSTQKKAYSEKRDLYMVDVYNLDTVKSAWLTKGW